MEYLGTDKPINHVQPLVSVCIPTFQHVKYIRECLESVLSQQTDFTFEILVGEDDSTDGTRQICIEYAEKYPDKIRLFLRKSEDKMIRSGKKIGRLNHLGLYRTARGRFVCICDGDDYWTSEHKLQLQVGLMRQYPEASICTTNTVLESDGGVLTADVPSQLTLYKASDLRKINYMGHISSWMMRNEMQGLLQNKAAWVCPGLDVVIFNFYKTKGKVLLTPEVTSFYRFNRQGSFKKLSNKEVHKKRLITSWYIFRYIHRDPVLWLRSLGFMAKRYYVNFLASRRGGLSGHQS